MFKLKLIIIIFLNFIFTNNTIGEIKINYKIGDEIITNIDILNEKKYLIFLRPNLVNLPESEVLKITENSLVREIIKVKEINRIFSNQDDLKFIDDVKKNLFRFKNVKNEKDFIKLTNQNNIEYEKIIKKIKYEALWNELIFKKYNSLIKIDEDKLRQQILKKIENNKRFEYNLSELLFDIDKDDNLKNKYNIISNYISQNDFKTAASRFSISNSSNKGGEIGWIKETLLSNNLNIILNKMNINEITKPIKYPNGYLILKINDKKEMKQTINIEKELKERIKFERNKQLNQFSLLYYKKLKQNTVIDEY